MSRSGLSPSATIFSKPFKFDFLNAPAEAISGSCPAADEAISLAEDGRFSALCHFSRPFHFMKNQHILTLEQFLNRSGQLFRFCAGGKSSNHFSVFIDQEFCKIPFDTLSQQPRRLFFQKHEQGVRIPAVDVNLGHDRERNVVRQRTKIPDFIGIPRLLIHKLIAGKAEYVQPSVLVVIVKFLQSFILRRKTALTGRVDNQQNLAFDLIQVIIFVFCGFNLEIVYICTHLPISK
jgi:hypothetical protein